MEHKIIFVISPNGYIVSTEYFNGNIQIRQILSVANSDKKQRELLNKGYFRSDEGRKVVYLKDVY